MAYNPFSLEGKTILVTGASSGIGRATAIECSRCGATVILTARNPERLNETLQSLEGEGHRIIECDLTSLEEVTRLVEQVPLLDGLVLSAGINDKSLVKFLSEEHIEKMLSTNFVAPVQLNRLLVKKKRLKKEASIVVISSAAAFLPSIANAMYASSKAALSQFSKVLALELMPQRIRVNAIEPVFVETDMVKKPEIVETIDAVREKSPFGRLLSPIEIALAAVYLLSDATKLVTGSQIIMDGGYLINR
jgi:NAD(P)-dependent dehydrogenase (short-subunit alcohol dehydrogenase family)